MPRASVLCVARERAAQRRAAWRASISFRPVGTRAHCEWGCCAGAGGRQMAGRRVAPTSFQSAALTVTAADSHRVLLPGGTVVARVRARGRRCVAKHGAGWEAWLLVGGGEGAQGARKPLCSLSPRIWPRRARQASCRDVCAHAYPCFCRPFPADALEEVRESGNGLHGRRCLAPATCLRTAAEPPLLCGRPEPLVAPRPLPWLPGVPQKKSQESINSRIQLVIKSGRYAMGYKQTLKALRTVRSSTGSGARGWASWTGRCSGMRWLPFLEAWVARLGRRLLASEACCKTCAELVAPAHSSYRAMPLSCLSAGRCQACDHLEQLPAPPPVRARVLRHAVQVRRAPVRG